MRKIVTDGEWGEAEKAAMKLLLETAKALDRKMAKPLRGVIWINESAIRCAARVQKRGQPADDKIKARELYRLEELHCEMMHELPADIEICIVMDVILSTAAGIMREVCRWIEVLMIEGRTCTRQREEFRYITIKVKRNLFNIVVTPHFYLEWEGHSHCSRR